MRTKTEFGFYSIEFYLHHSYDTSREEQALEIYPVYGVRFDILSRWFEKFSFKTISDQRNNYTVGADGESLNRQGKFYFLNSGKEFEKDCLSFIETQSAIAKAFFSKYKSISDYYINDVLPKLDKKCEMPDGGADWIFEYLTAVKISQPERYNEMVLLLKKRIEFMILREEPNVIAYQDKLDSIFDYLLNLPINML